MITQKRTSRFFIMNLGMWFQKFFESVTVQISDRMRQRCESSASLSRRRSCESQARSKNDPEDKFRTRSASMPGRPSRARTTRERIMGDNFSQMPFTRTGTRLGR